RYEDLEAWQLADALKREGYALTETGDAAKDFKYRDQIRDSAASNSKNIVEGFGRFRPAPFAQFMEVAVASAMETKESLQDRVDRGYFTPTRVATAQKLAERSIQCSTKLIVYLKVRTRRSSKGRHAERRTSNAERRTSNDARRTKNDARRTKNDARRTKNDARRTKNDERS